MLPTLGAYAWTARRADLALMYSQGFHPHPQIQLAAALPLGFSSRCEVLDMWVDGTLEVDALPARIQSAVPDGLRILTSLRREGVRTKTPASVRSAGVLQSL